VLWHPDLSSARALFYNMGLFTQAGIAAPPRTWEDFVSDAKKVQALGNGDIGYAMAARPGGVPGRFRRG
jgi:multiple sugar transport system substrate-binding protein